MTPERLAEIRASDARVSILGPAPGTCGEHRRELLAEVDRLTAERDAVLRQLVRVLGAPIEELIEASSLGTPEAKAARESVPIEVAQRIVARAKEAE